MNDHAYKTEMDKVTRFKDLVDIDNVIHNIPWHDC